ncbi:hypothetical protein KOW79_001748 [Hemibagrus wyckioides]|uniref:Uncharacterized protein n=1 Tax=Hemibagrus wyckioides TaxID=337641 RepID=A0A9D3SSM0_9TELE|nr:hypothetical protein KOW79_001748 [Hemibagrus wyckioides]
MGCTTGHLACQPQPASSTNQEGQTQEGAAKVPEVLSSLERLSQATGGMEKSWYRCIFPFGIISLVIGIAGTGVTYTYNDLPQTKVVSVVLLIVGVVLVELPSINSPSAPLLFHSQLINPILQFHKLPSFQHFISIPMVEIPITLCQEFSPFEERPSPSSRSDGSLSTSCPQTKSWLPSGSCEVLYQ